MNLSYRNKMNDNYSKETQQFWFSMLPWPDISPAVLILNAAMTWHQSPNQYEQEEHDAGCKAGKLSNFTNVWSNVFTVHSNYHSFYFCMTGSFILNVHGHCYSVLFSMFLTLIYSAMQVKGRHSNARLIQNSSFYICYLSFFPMKQFHGWT